MGKPEKIVFADKVYHELIDALSGDVCYNIASILERDREVCCCLDVTIKINKKDEIIIDYEVY